MEQLNLELGVKDSNMLEELHVGNYFAILLWIDNDYAMLEINTLKEKFIKGKCLSDILVKN